MAHSLMVCEEGSKPVGERSATINRIWYETVAPIASRAAVVEMVAGVFASVVLVMEIFLVENFVCSDSTL